MEVKLPNGCSVNRLWGDHSEGELLAAFQYDTDAVEFAKAKLAEDAKREMFDSFYAIASSYSGKIQVIRHSAAKRVNGT